MKKDFNKTFEKVKDIKVLLLIVIVGLILLASLLMIIGMQAKFDVGFGVKSSVADALKLGDINLFDYAKFSREANQLVKQPQMNLVNTALAGFSFFIIVLPIIILEVTLFAMPFLKEKQAKNS